MNPNLLPITIYTQPNCQPCRLTKQFLEKHGFRYVEIDVTTDPDALEKLKTWNYSQVPVVFVPFDYPEDFAGTHWSGLIPDKLKELASATVLV